LSTCGKFLLYKFLVFVNAAFDTAHFEVGADPNLVTDETDQSLIVGDYYHSTLQAPQRTTVITAAVRTIGDKVESVNETINQCVGAS